MTSGQKGVYEYITENQRLLYVVRSTKDSKYVKKTAINGKNVKAQPFLYLPKTESKIKLISNTIS